MTRNTTACWFAISMLAVCPALAQKQPPAPDLADLSVKVSDSPPASSFLVRSVSAKDELPDFEPLDRDEFLGQVENAMSGRGFTESIDPFSGTLHLTMVDVVLPGNAGLDIVIQRSYSSNVVNRVDNTLLTRHAASADASGRLGDSGWQLHMGKLMNPYPGPDSHTTLIFPDGSTHMLFNRDGHPGEKISQEGWLYSVSGAVHAVRLTNGLTYYFDSAAEAGWYYYMAIENGAPVQVLQCTRIEDLNGNAINIEYSRWDGYGGVAAEYVTLIDRVWFGDPDDNRSVRFTYYPDSWNIQKIDVMDGAETVQTWTYYFGDPKDNYVLQPQYPLTESRSVKSLVGVLPPEGNPWLFEYYDLDTPWEEGRWLLKSVQSPRVSRTTYTWAPEVFSTGAEYCSEVPEFLAVQTRQTAFHTGVDDVYEDETTTTYTYTNGGREDATSTVVTTDSQTGVVLATEEQTFHGWGPYTFFDADLWKVGLGKSSIVTTMDDEGNPLETVTTTSVWEQSDDVISFDTRRTSSWVACGGMRELSPVKYVRPVSVTRVVERHDSLPNPPPEPPPDPDTYTTVSSEFDNWGNVGLITEASSDGLARTTALTYWRNQAKNIMVGRVQGRDLDPGGAECRQYDALGRVTKTFTNPAIDDVAECHPTDPVSGARRVDLFYDGLGNLGSQIERSSPADRVTTYQRYTYGSPQDTIIATGTGDDIHICRDYGPLGTVSWETDGRGCDEAFRTEYDYDTLGRLKTVDPPIVDPTTFDYYNDWTQVTVTRGSQEFIYGFDRFGGLTNVYNAQTGHWTQITNDALGRRRQVAMLWNPEPGDTFTYDPLGRLTAVIHPGDPATMLTYDYAGSRVTAVDEKQHATTYHYEAFGDPGDRRLAHLVDAGGNTTSYGYEPVYGGLGAVSAPIPQGNRSFQYVTGSPGCGNGLLESETHPESGTTTHQYNCLGAVTSRMRAGPELTTFGYDTAGRLTRIDYPDAAGTVTMAYDGGSRRTLLENDWATEESTYDDAGRLETVTQGIAGGPQGLVTAYTYDTLGRLETATYPSGRVVTHGWDDRDWLVSLTGEAGSDVAYLPSITYHKTGAPDLVTFANGVTTDHWIDDRNRLVGITSAWLMQIGIGYDDASNVERWNDLYSPAKSRSFSYDELDRLETATSPGLWGDLSFTYDELGNRLTRTLNGETTTYAYESSTNRLATLTGDDEGEFLYDDVGRLIEEVRGPGPDIFADGFESGTTGAWNSGAKHAKVATSSLTYTFNSADQLTLVTRAGQTMGDYAYDGDGLRVGKTVGEQTVFYLRGPSGNTLAEYDQDGLLIAEYIYAGDRQVAKVEPDGGGGDDLSFFHPDQLGTALYITDESGAITWSGDYFPFGAEYSSTGTPDRYRFTQHELDPDTALVYAKARYYHPTIGRFISTDPVGGSVGSSQSWNRYAYVLNNPLKYTDFDGQLPVIPIVIGFIFAVAGGAEYANTPTGPQDPILTNPQYENSGGMYALAAASKGAVVGVFIDRLIASHDSERLPLDWTVPSHRPTVQENRAKGDAFRDEIAGGMEQEGFGVKKEVRKETPFGPRVIDLEVSKDGDVKGGIETKSGNSPYKPSQRTKDEYLRRQGYPVDVVRDK